MPWIATLALAVLLTTSAPVHAEQNDRTVRDIPGVPGSDIEMIGPCVRQVREASNDPRFDAYVRQGGGMGVTVTSDAARRFTACLRAEPTSEETPAPAVSPMPRPHSRPRDSASREPTTKPSSGRRP
jgi:hypothetical protein